MSKQLIKNLTEAIKNDDEISSTAIFSEGFLKEPSRFVEKIRQKGVFRASKYDFKAITIKNTINNFLQENPLHRLPKDIAVYLESVLSLLHIAFSIHSIYKNFLRNLTNKDLRAFLVSIEWLFWQDRENNIKTFQVSYKDFRREQLAEGFSFYYFHFCQKPTPEVQDIIFIDTAAIKEGKYLDILDSVVTRYSPILRCI